jgi:hypothetical protein
MRTQTTFDAYTAELQPYEAAVSRQARRDTVKRLKHDTTRVNVELYEMGLTYHDGVPLSHVNEILCVNGFNPLDAMILCGRTGQLHESVGRNRWLSLTWYKMASGRYEVIAYVS